MVVKIISGLYARVGETRVLAHVLAPFLGQGLTIMSRISMKGVALILKEKLMV